jgi:ferric-dicitrate binding protein FerR (iron transport regulator)
MKDRHPVRPIPPELSADFDEDVEIAVDLAAGRLTTARAGEVRERLRTDADFRAVAQPILDAWSAPAATQPDVERGWRDLISRAEDAGLAPLTPYAVSIPMDKRERRRRMFVLLAASVAFIAVGATVFDYWFNRRVVPVLTERTARESVVTWSPSSYTLPDGSVIAMTTGASLNFVPGFANGREVTFSGDARFNVEPGATPFVVKTETAIITVLGTTFNVSAHPGGPAIVQVIQGTVRIQSRTPMNPDIVVRLEAGQRGRVMPNAAPESLP